MSRASAFPILALLSALACADAPDRQTAVDVVRVAPMQRLDDSLEVTPALDTSHNTPEQGRVALSIEVHVRNAGRTTRLVPSIAFRALPESGRDTMAGWRYDITRRTVDSLLPGQSATFGLTVSPGSLGTGTVVDGVYRIEAVLGDSTTDRRTLPLGRIQLRSPVDST